MRKKAYDPLTAYQDLARYPNSTLLPFLFGVSLLKQNSRKKGTFVIYGLLRNLACVEVPCRLFIQSDAPRDVVYTTNSNRLHDCMLEFQPFAKEGMYIISAIPVLGNGSADDLHGGGFPLAALAANG